MKLHPIAWVAAFIPALALGDVVDNPGTITLTFDSTASFIQVGTLSAPLGDSAVLVADVQSDGNIVIDTELSVFPDGTVFIPVLGDVIVRLEIIGAAMGTINPVTGEAGALLVANARLINGALGPDCHIGPVTLSTSAVVPYDMTTGRVVLGGAGFPVPAAEQCGLLTQAINVFLQLPSTDSSVQFDTLVNPILVGS